MKKIINTIQNKLSAIATRTKTALANTRGEGYVDTGVKISSRSSPVRSCSPGSTSPLQHDDHADCNVKVTELFNYQGLISPDTNRKEKP